MAAALCACALAATVFASSTPSIPSLSAEGSGNAFKLEADIRPNGLYTAYEFWLERPACEVNSGASCGETINTQIGSGHVAAEHLEQEITVELSGLQWEHTYGFWVIAENSAGAVQRTSTFTITSEPLPGAPEGTGAGEPFESPTESWNNEGARREAEEAARLEAEREALAHAGQAPPPQNCLVPQLKGDSIASARSTLQGSHCGLRVAHKPRRHRGKLVVVAQNWPPETELPPGGTVNVRLGRRRS